MMRKGRMPIHKNRNGGKPGRCVGCGKKGVFRVTFEDDWGKLIVTLCKNCSTKEYVELKLQSRLDWPIVA
jgi:hypothetical protein